MQNSQAPASDSSSKTLQCNSCGAGVVFERHIRATVCPYCASPQVLERPPTPDRPNPTFAMGFALPEAKAMKIARRWVRGRRWIAPLAFHRSDPQNIKGLYLPVYLYSAAAYSNYSCDIGENYTVVERDSKGNTRTRTKTEWRRLSGQHACYLNNVVVTASKGIPNDELESVEPFHMHDLRRYGKKIVSGFIAEEPSMDPRHCMGLANEEAKRDVGKRLKAFMPGDRQRNLQFNTQLKNEDLELALLPIWVLAVRWSDKKDPVRLLVNGQTGKLHGKTPISAIKVAMWVLLGLAVVTPIVMYFVNAS